jgi:acyl-ACP thioesterase
MLTELQHQLKENYLVTSADVDFQQKIRFSSLTNFLIQIAWKHAEILKWGVDDLMKHNLVWVLSAMQIKLDNYPGWREQVTIETWPKGINRLFYLRDFIIYDSGGKKIGKATSNWILIDVTSRRPKLHQLDDEVFKKNLNRHAIEEIIPSLKFKGQVESETNYITKYSDIDVNNHLTTTRYIDWIFDTYDLEQLKTNPPLGLTVNFNKEVVFGKEVVMQRSEKENNVTHFQLMSQDNGQTHLKAELIF